jgi:hypothetical protein
VQSAWFDLGVQPSRLPVEVSDTVVLGDDYDRRHFVGFDEAKADRIIIAASAALARIGDGGW